MFINGPFTFSFLSANVVANVLADTINVIL